MQKMTRDEAIIAWLSELRDPRSKRHAYDLESIENPRRRSCLGHACHALGVERSIEKTVDGPMVLYGNSSHILPSEVGGLLRISQYGNFKSPVNYRRTEYTCLTRLNDETDITPQEIADVVQIAFYTDNFMPFAGPRKFLV